MTSEIAFKKYEQREFYKSYQSLCVLKQLACQSIKETEGTHLEVMGDNVSMDEWGPILISLERDQSLCAIAVRAKPFSHILAMDFEEQVREYCTRPILQTRFVMMNLMKALTSSLIGNDRLQHLTLDGLHLSDEYLAVLADGLARSRGLEVLALRRCGIRDAGLASVFLAIRDSSNVVALDFSQCDITEEGMLLLSKLIGHQRRLRASAGWTPEGGYGAESFMGVRRITLNHNPGIGDNGALRLAAALAAPDEAWIKALDLQDCGLTDKSAIRFLELLDDGNPEMEVIDVRANDVNPCIVREILRAAGGTLDFPLLPQGKKITIHQPIIEIPKQNSDCFNSSPINIRQRPSTSSVAKAVVKKRSSHNALALRKPSYSKVSPVYPSSTQLSSSVDGRDDTFRLDLKVLEDSDSSVDSERTILKGLDEIPCNVSASELKKRGQEITEAIEAARKRRLMAQEAVKKAEDEMRDMMNTMEKERLLKEEGMRKREEITGLIREIDDEEMKRLALREMGKMVRDKEFMNFRRLKSEGDLTANVSESTEPTERSRPPEVHPNTSYREVSDLLEQFEHQARLNSLEYAGGLEVARPRTANRVEAVLKKRHRPDCSGNRPKPRATPADILEQLCQRDVASDGRCRSPTGTLTNMQSATERIAAMLRETSTVFLQEIDGSANGEEF